MPGPQPSPHDTQTALMLTLLVSLQSTDAPIKQKAILALEQIGEHNILAVLLERMRSGSPDEAWDAIKAIRIVMENCGAGQVREIASIMQERIDGIGGNQSTGREAFIRVALTKLKEISIEISEKKERGLRSILSEGKPKPPKLRRATPRPLKRAASSRSRKAYRSNMAVPRPKGH